MAAESDRDDAFATSDETVRQEDGGKPRPVTPVEIGTMLAGRYEIEKLLGQGGAGQVFRARDRMVDEPVAVKVLRADHAANRSWVRRLVREVKVARAIRHPNVCRVHELGSADGRWFVTMELASGGTLRDLLAARSEEGRSPIRRAFPDQAWTERLRDARAVCAGLAAIHAVGITHRDVTPQNVLRMSDGRLVISDFGLAVNAQESTTFHGGTPRYMAPEVLAGARADQRSDVFQLGMLLHEILFDRRADWEHRDDRVRLRRPIGPDAHPVEEEIFQLCAACLSQTPEGRPADAVTVAGRLAAAEHAKLPTLPTRLWLHARRAARHPVVRVAALVVGVAALAAQGARVLLRPERCPDARRRIASIWGPAEREAVRRAFVATGGVTAAARFAAVDRMLAEHLRRWTADYTDACQGTEVRHDQPAEVMDLRMACLSEDLEAVSALTRVFRDADAALIDNALPAASSLDLARCSNLQQLRSTPVPPGDPRVRAGVQALRPKIEEARALLEAARFRNAGEAAAALLPQAEQLGYKPALAEALELRGLAANEVYDFATALPYLRRAFTLAEESGHDRVVATSAIMLAYAEGVSGGPGFEPWARIAKAALVRSGDDPRARLLLYNCLSSARCKRGDPAGALEDAWEAVRIAEKAYGTHPWLGESLGNAANALQALGRLDEALAVNQRAMGVLRQVTDPASAALAKVVNNQGEYLLALRRPAEAVPFFNESATAFERSPAEGGHMLDVPLIGLGRALLAQGQTARAVAVLERTVHLRQQPGSSRPALAEAQLALALALDAAGRHDRAAALARQALVGYPAVGPGGVDFSKERATIAALLDGAGRSGRRAGR